MRVCGDRPRELRARARADRAQELHAKSQLFQKPTFPAALDEEPDPERLPQLLREEVPAQLVRLQAEHRRQVHLYRQGRRVRGVKDYEEPGRNHPKERREPERCGGRQDLPRKDQLCMQSCGPYGDLAEEFGQDLLREIKTEDLPL